METPGKTGPCDTFLDQENTNIASAWKCRCCTEEGTNLPPEQCPVCEQWDIEILEAGARLQLQGWSAIQKRIDEVRRLLKYGKGTVELYGETVDLEWEYKGCSHSNCPTETKTASFPISYLWMSNDAIREAEKAKP